MAHLESFLSNELDVKKIIISRINYLILNDLLLGPGQFFLDSSQT